MTQICGSALDTGNGLWTGPCQQLREVSWRDVHRRASVMACTLQGLGAGRGTRIGVLAIDPLEVATLIQATWLCGGTVTMLQQPTPQADLAEWEQACVQVISMLDIEHVVLGGPFLDAESGFAAHGVTIVRMDRDWGDVPGERIECDEDDVGIYQLTSGSTGMPKAVGISHRNLYANAIAMQRGSLGTPDTDVMVSWLPLSHDMGLIGFLLTPMFYGMKAVCVSPLEFLRSPLNWLRIITDHRGTITAAPNFAYSLMQRRLATAEEGRYDLSTLRFALCGAEPIDPVAMRGFAREAERFGFRESAIVAAYGMAEATLAVTFAELGAGLRVDVIDPDELATANRAVETISPQSGREVVLLGAPLHGMEVRVLTAEGTDAGSRVVGELAIRGDAVTTHYLTENGRVAAVDEHGWLHTGDIGYLTDEGQVAICGRSKNVIIVSGRNIYPADIEKAAESVEGVRKGGVVAFGNTRQGRAEELWIVVEIGGGSVDHREIQKGVARKIFGLTGVSPKVLTKPRGAIPKTPSGKIRHVDAKRIFAAADA